MFCLIAPQDLTHGAFTASPSRAAIYRYLCLVSEEAIFGARAGGRSFEEAN
jgi:hypothetical protein